jgi:hypothetical protein
MIGGLVLAGALAIMGMNSSSLKVFLFAFLAPGFVLMTTWLVAILREPRWYRIPPLVTMALFATGGALFSLAVVVWLPWMPPDAWLLEEVPIVIRMLLVAGILLTFIGLVGGALGQAIESRRR